MKDVFDSRLKVPFSLIVSGPPGSGKSTFVEKLIHARERLLNHSIDYIICCYGVETKFVQQLRQNLFDIPITLINGLPDDFSSYIIPNKRGLVIIDDLMQSAGDSKSVTDLFCNKLQHTSTSVILILQNLFYHGRERTTFLRCTNYLVVYKNPMDYTIPLYLSRKLLPKNNNLFIDIFERATSRPYGYIFCDGKHDTPDNARFRTDLFNDGIQKVFVVNYSTQQKMI